MTKIKITIETGTNVYNLTLDEARELYNKLDDIFGDRKSLLDNWKPYNPSPSIPFIPLNDNPNPWDRNTIYGSNNKDK